MKLSLVLAESALELIPKEIQRSPAVTSDTRRRDKDPSEILLDRSFHHTAMLRLRDAEKRGRPDLVHTALLSATSTPLFLDGMLRMYVHTSNDLVLEVREGTRIPKNYIRFRGLAEKLLAERPNEGLVRVYGGSIEHLVAKVISPDLTVGFSTQGKPAGLAEVAQDLMARRSPCVIVGAFPHGHFSRETLASIGELLRIHRTPLESHVVVSRLLYEVEKASERTND